MKGNRTLFNYLLVLIGVGYILLFMGSAIFVTFMQSFGFYSFTGESRFTLEHWRIIFDQEVKDSLLFSLKMGIGSSFGTLLFAYPMALYLRKAGFGKKTLGSFVKIPLFIPALVSAFLILNLISYHGIVNEVLSKFGLVSEPLRMLHDKRGIGVIFIQIWKNTPFVLLILSASLASIKDDVVDAAKNLRANKWALTRYIYIPLTMPGILVSLILMFIRAFGDYPITKVAGPNYPTSLAVRMLITATEFQEWHQAAVIGVIVIVTALFVVWLYSKLIRTLYHSD